MRDTFLMDSTGRHGRYWVEFIQKKIVEHSKPTSDPNHPQSEPDMWLYDLSTHVWERVKIAHPDLTQIDENIVTASAVATILTLWVARLKRTKCYDPRRPSERRRRAYLRHLKFDYAIMDCLLNEAQDHDMFPLPEHDPPFAPNAKDGDFV